MAETAVEFGGYLLLHRVAVGGMAEVFRAQRRSRPPGEPDVALKRLLPPLLEDPAVAQLFLREVEALRRMDDPAVRLLDAGQDRGIPFVVMPWLGGATLRQVLRLDQRDAQVPLDLTTALVLAAQVADALATAHRVGVIHRDVSPSNVQITAAGSVHLIDFGIARVAGLAQTTHGGSLRGKWAYAAPEQIAGQPLDGRTDLFALGSVLVECLTGHATFSDTDREATLARIQRAEPLHWPQLPAEQAELATLLHSLHARDPADRPARAADVAQALRLAIALPPDDALAHARATLAARVAQVPMPSPTSRLQPAELRGEDVTQPELDADATRVRL